MEKTLSEKSVDINRQEIEESKQAIDTTKIIIERAVELAKVAWTSTGQDNAQMMLQAGQRSE